MKNLQKGQKNVMPSEEPVEVEVFFSDAEGWQKVVETLPSGNVVERKFRSVTQMMSWLSSYKAGREVMVSQVVTV